MTDSPLHSVGIDEQKCIGCTECLKACPTEAIRIRGRKAVILDERCIDCGICVRVCPVSAVYARTDKLRDIEKFHYRIALVGPEIYGEFGDDIKPELILQAISGLGFHEVHDVAAVCEEEIVAIRKYLSSQGVKKPVISFSCPSVARLIRARFPGLLEHLVPLRSPMGAAARYLRENRPKELGIEQEEMGLFYITPCLARMTRVRRPLTDKVLYYSGAISLADIYGDVLNEIRTIRKQGHKSTSMFMASGLGIGWGAAGGEVKSLMMDDCLYVDGMANLIRIFNNVERGVLSRLNYIEAMACAEGCVGGPLMVDNALLARNKLQKLAKLSSEGEINGLEKRLKSPQRPGYYRLESDLKPKSIDRLDPDPKEAIRIMNERDLICDQLPGIDCGVCGAPTCRTLALDIVHGRAHRTDCIFVLFEQANEMIKRVNEWSSKLPSNFRRSAKKHQKSSR